MNFFKGITIGSIIILFCLVGYIIFNQKKIAFINTGKVFNGFDMTKRIDADVKKIEDSKHHYLDSLIEAIKKVDAGVLKMEQTQFEYLKKEYIYKSKQFSTEIESLKQTNIEKIWQQINNYVAKYSKDKNYNIVLGANGQGALMYADEAINIDEDLIKYINDKYNDKK